MAARVSVAVEGYLDLAIVDRLFGLTGLERGDVLWGSGLGTGKGGLDKRVAGYRQAALHGRTMFVLRDLDHDAPCAPALLRGLNMTTGGPFCLRIAVREAEAWLIADRERLSDFLHLRPGSLPDTPEALDDPKAVLVAAARLSYSKPVRIGFTARPGSGRPEGPDYPEHIERFTRLHWHPEHAATRADSLARAIARLHQLRTALAA
jgi:hypothetical protein